jgi:uncharacterized alkaline shock family protein YloU
MATPDDDAAGGRARSAAVEEAAAACVKAAVSRTEGIHGLFGGFPDTLSQNILGKELRFKGMRISGEGGIVIDMQVTVEFGVKIPEAVWNLQKNVKAELGRASGAPVKAVNVIVQGVHGVRAQAEMTEAERAEAERAEADGQG